MYIKLIGVFYICDDPFGLKQIIFTRLKMSCYKIVLKFINNFDIEADHYKIISKLIIDLNVRAYLFDRQSCET